jgi:DnaJ-class molecular chaperone
MSSYKNHLTPTDLAKCKKLAPNIVRCDKCKGSGLVPKKAEITICSCLPCKFCIFCQNKYKYGNYVSCSNCYGLGVLTKERNQNINNEIINYNSIS